MEWLDAKDCPPIVPGKILVKIGERYFIGHVYLKKYFTLILFSEESINYEISEIITLDGIDYSSGGKGWIFPSHFKFPEKYCYIEKEEVKASA